MTTALGAPSNVPAVLLPIRLETGWIQGDLLVRVYPDVWHRFSHVAALTGDEAAIATQFWDADTDERLAVWAQMRHRFGTPRATWIVHASTGGVPAKETWRSSSWDTPVIARGLPDR